MSKVTYKDAGVDLAAYDDALARLPRLLRRTFTPRVLDRENGFAGLFRLDFGSPLFDRHYRRPVLVGATDGVGTKLKVAQRLGKHGTIGIDLVAMCVNDAICCGAEPLVFLDYVAMSRDDPPLLEQIVKGISDGCVMCDAALIGGETAIMPDLYRPGEYDLAGFCVGVVEQERIVDGSSIEPGDTILGVASAGLHSNGFSLARRIVFDTAGLSGDDHIESCGETVGELLLRPTIIYARPVRAVLAHYKVKSVVRGIAHITGGGLFGNLKRILPPGSRACIRPGSWPVPPVFTWLQQLGCVDTAEMYKVFNMGVGLCLVVRTFFVDSICQQLAGHGLSCWPIGQIASHPQGPTATADVAWDEDGP
jgi:phosphoribosylformylglycinamidine cyclo-ligase